MNKLLTLTAASTLALLVPILALPLLLASGVAMACTPTSTPTVGAATPSASAVSTTGTRPVPGPTTPSVTDARTGEPVAAPSVPTDTTVPDSNATAGATTTTATIPSGCDPTPDGSGEAGPDGHARLLVPPGTPGDVSAAIERALSYVGLHSGYAHHCDRLACRAWNYANSGYESATAHWYAMTATGHAHPGDRCPPAGTFVYWATGDSAGHVAFVAQTDPGCNPTRILLVSNDYGDHATGNYGGVYLVSLAAIESGFVTRTGYRGWSDPICAGALLRAGTHHPLPN